MKKIKCSNCEHDEFIELQTVCLDLYPLVFQTNKPKSDAFTVFACKKCGHLEWFLTDDKLKSFITPTT